MEVWYRALFFANHSRSLCRFSCRRNTKTSGLKKAVSAMKIPPVQSSVYRLRSACLYLSPDQHCKLHGIVNGCLQLGAWLDGLSPQPNGGNQAGGYKQCTTFTFFRHASQCRRTKSEYSSPALNCITPCRRRSALPTVPVAPFSRSDYGGNFYGERFGKIGERS